MKKASKKVILKDVRCSYVYINNTNKHDKYGVQALLANGSPQLKKAQQTLKAVFCEAFGEAEWAKKGRYQICLRDGDNDAVNGGDAKDGDEYRGHWFMNASNKSKPGVVNRKLEEPTEMEMDELGFSGAYFNLSLTMSAHPAIDSGKPGVACYLNNVQLNRAGDRLDGSVAASSEFEAFGSDDDDDGFGDDDFA